MRKFITVSLLAALAAGSGCRKQESAPPAQTTVSSEILAGYHFVGTGALANNSNASRLREIWTLAESRKLVEQTLQKLARSPGVFTSGQIPRDQEERGAALLRPLLDDLIRHESFLQVRGPAIQQAEWTLLVQLPPDRVKAWQTALPELTRLWNLGAPTAGALDGFTVSEIKRNSTPNRIQWAEAGQWFVLGVGQDNLPVLSAATRQIKTAGRPIPTLATNWLEAEVNLPRLSTALDLSGAFKWPHAKLTVAGEGENLRSKLRMIFPEPMTGPLDPWQVPTNIINEPLVSFTAVRGIAPWLKQCGLFQKLDLTPVPNEMFFWAQEHITFQSFLAFPLKDAAAKLERAGPRAASLFGTNWQSRGMAQVGWDTNTQQLLWKVPYAPPFLKPAAFKGREFVVGGLFAPSPLTNPPPAELLSQLTSQPKLVYYDWEITQPRLTSWRILAQLMAVIAGKEQFTTNTAGLPWLIAIEAKLGNSATEISAVSPAEWSLVRKSHIGFTGVELVGLARWLESTNFPKFSFELPPDRTMQAAPAAQPPPAITPAPPAAKPPGK